VDGFLLRYDLGILGVLVALKPTRTAPILGHGDDDQQGHMTAMPERTLSQNTKEIR